KLFEERNQGSGILIRHGAVLELFGDALQGQGARLRTDGGNSWLRRFSLLPLGGSTNQRRSSAEHRDEVASLQRAAAAFSFPGRASAEAKRSCIFRSLYLLYPFVKAR